MTQYPGSNLKYKKLLLETPGYSSGLQEIETVQQRMKRRWREL
jgi:hypothetical protein